MIAQNKEKIKGKLARLRLRIWDLADPSLFSPARLADKRPPEPASCQSPLPEERRSGLLLSSGLHTFSAACVPRRFGSVAQFRLVQRRMEQVPSRLSFVDLQGLHPVERHLIVSGSLAPFCLAERVSPFSFAEVKVLCVSVRSVSYIFAVHLH